MFTSVLCNTSIKHVELLQARIMGFTALHLFTTFSMFSHCSAQCHGVCTCTVRMQPLPELFLFLCMIIVWQHKLSSTMSCSQACKFVVVTEPTFERFSLWGFVSHLVLSLVTQFFFVYISNAQPLAASSSMIFQTPEILHDFLAISYSQDLDALLKEFMKCGQIISGNPLVQHQLMYWITIISILAFACIFLQMPGLWVCLV